MRATFGDITAIAQGIRQWMMPDGVPGVGQDVSKTLIVGLTRQNIAVRFQAHIVIRGGTAFNAQGEHQWVEMAVLSGGVPNESLSAFLSEVARQFQ